ncbi:hypothetical protein like AT3G50780 [Hibiscus trionum]|uniref:Uncharacterized protein n=1 Tax=Hibiscus trionum TaxID=183268 RepID=A0A9W7GZ27_HIBTR|nr:hypothetical protein like AT3G50780 [Hibiscus trionum]
MAKSRVSRIEQGQPKIRNVPIAVTPEGFWCCPSPVVFQKTLKSQKPLNKHKSSSSPPLHKKQIPLTEKKPMTTTPIRSAVTSFTPVNLGISVPIVPERVPRPKVEHIPRNVAIEFGEPGTSDTKVILLGKQGFCVKLSVHKKVLLENSCFFTDKLSEQDCGLCCLEIDDCEDVV